MPTNEGKRHDASEPQGPLDPSLTEAITINLVTITKAPNFLEKKAEIERLSQDFFSLRPEESTPTEYKAWVQAIAKALDIEASFFSSIADDQYPDYAVVLARFIGTRQHIMLQLSEPSATPDRRIGSMPQQDGDLAQPPRNRRSTDLQTPPIPVIADTSTLEESKGIGALLRCLWSKIMPKKSG
jgi:hypothetical protein